MVKEKYNVYYRALKELSEIIKFFPRNEYRKIPKTFINFIEENKDNSYEYIIEHIDDFQNQAMLDETRVLLSIVYRDFIASNKEKKQITDMEKNELLEEEKRIREKYNPDNIFKKRDIQQKENVITNEVAIIRYKESVFIKIKNWIKRTF